MPGTWAHLARRMMWSLTAPPPTADQEAVARSLLTHDEWELFAAQPAVDRRHAIETEMALGGDDEAVRRAGLLHDIGKRHAGLGIVGRSLASAMSKLRLPLPVRFRMYLDHGPIAAAELAGIGSDTLAIEFARHHHGERPPSIEPGVWQRLVAADEPPASGSLGIPTAG